MYVARRAFRNYNQIVLPGSAVEPGSTKWFKTRLKDGVIIEINAHNFKEWAAYFKAKFGVTLTEEKPNEEPKEESKEESKDELKEEANDKPKVVKVVVQQ